MTDKQTYRMTDRQRHNWRAVVNACDALRKLNTVNTQSVCDYISLFNSEERNSIECLIKWLEDVGKELERNERSQENSVFVITVHEIQSNYVKLAGSEQNENTETMVETIPANIETLGL